MKTVTICTPHNQVLAKLSEHFSDADFSVDTVETEEGLRALLKRETRDALIIEKKRESFADIMRFCFQVNPSMCVHFFWDEGIFCFYPASSQPTKLVDTLISAGLRVPPSLMKYAKTARHADHAPVLV
jgi:hypothetical protein